MRAQTGYSDLFPRAEAAYQHVIDAYEGGDSRLKGLAAYGYVGMGAVYERRTQDYARAAVSYRRGRDLAEDEAVRKLAEERLDAIEQLRKTLSPEEAGAAKESPSPTMRVRTP